MPGCASRCPWPTVSVRRSWPRTLTVTVVAAQRRRSSCATPGRPELVDADGVAFGTVRAAPDGVPVVTAPVRGPRQEALRSSLALLEALPPTLSRSVSGIRVSSANLVTFTLGSRDGGVGRRRATRRARSRS